MNNVCRLLLRPVPWLALACASLGNAALIDISTEPLETYSAPSSTDVKPNVLFLLDDSGSMDWDFMPDWACTSNSIQNSTCNSLGQTASSSEQEYLFRNAAYNGIYYNPAIRYVPPVAFSSGGAMNSTAYPSQVGTSSATGADGTSKPNWKAVKDDAYGVQNTSTSNLVWDPASSSTRPPYFFTVIPGEYCTTPSLRVCVAQSAPSATYRYPAKLRWCNSSSLTTCKAGFDSTYSYARIPRPTISTITVGTGSSTFVTSISVGGTQILASQTTGSNNATTVATRIAEQINASSAGYTAYATGAVVTIVAPFPATTTATPVVSSSGPMRFTITAFARQGNSSERAVPGAMVMTSITPARTAYSYPNTAAKAPARTDCAAETCTYSEEMTNFANWWTYYRTRMQMMKSASSNAFSVLDRDTDVASGVSRFRVGFMTINNSTNSDFLNLGEFAGTQKGSWYAKLTGASPNGSTPLRAALSKAGRLYAGLYNGRSLNGVTVTDPLQYSCQQNYTILSTDGFWNESSGYTKLNGSTTVGNQDGSQPRPLYDGTNTSNTLADVATYYYETDLRDDSAGTATGTCVGPTIPPSTTPNNLCVNNVPPFGRDVATTQHMTTFTLGLGAQGQMVFSPSYWNDTSGDFHDIKVGTTAAPSSGICSWQSGGSGACNWPVPTSNAITTIDDLWHAAINGRGSYYSATDPEGLVTGLASTLDTITNTPTPGTAAAAATSSPNMTGSDNYVYSSSYTSVQWHGELVRQQIDNAGNLSSQQWSAMRLLDCATSPWRASFAYVAGDVYQYAGACYVVTTAHTSSATSGNPDAANATMIQGAAPATRRIYIPGSLGRSLTAFAWDNLSATQRGYFTKPSIAGLTQFCASGGNCLSSTQQTNTTIATGGAAGEALVRYLAGERTYEGSYFRQRTHVLGDIVSSEQRYYAAPSFIYTDPGYHDFKLAQASRAATLYVGANDGMLHAFNGVSGQERWAYIPQLVLPEIYKLADTNYNLHHQYFVDGSPVVGDVCPNAPSSTCSGGQWKTIVVGSLNRGGRGYFALDVTDPDNPAALWEFTDANLGYSYGNPVITKLKDGTWVTIFSSGYNNADGVGRLYIVNAMSGSLIRSISTGVGLAGSPSGLGGIVGHALSPLTNNTTVAVYGGDVLGNVWRFDINNDLGASGYDAQLLATLRDSAGNVQPITAAPTIITYDGARIVLVGTGRFLGTTDIADTRTQSFYAIKDQLGSATYGSIRSAATGFVAQTLTVGSCPAGAVNPFCAAGQAVRVTSSNAVDWKTQNGWYFDFTTGGERVTTTPELQLGTLLFTTITPQAATANACGQETGNSASFIYAIDFVTGSAVPGSGSVGGVSLGNGLATAPTIFKLPDGSVKALVRVSVGVQTGTDMGSSRVITPPVRPALPTAARRVTWREMATR